MVKHCLRHIYYVLLREGVKKPPISYGPVRNVLSPTTPAREKPVFADFKKKKKKKKLKFFKKEGKNKR